MKLTGGFEVGLLDSDGVRFVGNVPAGWSTAKVNCSRSNHRLDARPLLLYGSLAQLGSSKVVLEA